LVRDKQEGAPRRAGPDTQGAFRGLGHRQLMKLGRAWLDLTQAKNEARTWHPGLVADADFTFWDYHRFG